MPIMKALVQVTPKLKIPEPKAYDGKQDVHETENFLWHMEQYFEAMAMRDDPTKFGPLCYI